MLQWLIWKQRQTRLINRRLMASLSEVGMHPDCVCNQLLRTYWLCSMLHIAHQVLSSVGLLCASIAHHNGCCTSSTTRVVRERQCSFTVACQSPQLYSLLKVQNHFEPISPVTSSSCLLISACSLLQHLHAQKLSPSVHDTMIMTWCNLAGCVLQSES